MLTGIWSYIEKNRWTVICPLVAVIVWLIVGVSCTATTPSPTRPNVEVDARQLEQDFETWQAEVTLTAKRFEYAREDLERQQQQLNALQEALMQLASGSVTSWSGLLQILFTGGFVGLFADNIRKNGVIGGLKRNK
jgi:5-bromo-4-chloroindolyl phosphate hydrolysis protein